MCAEGLGFTVWVQGFVFGCPKFQGWVLGLAASGFKVLGFVGFRPEVLDGGRL